MSNKIVLPILLSVVLVVAVVIGAVVVVKNYNKDVESRPENLSPEMKKALSFVCAPTEHKDLCVESLRKAAPDGTTDPKELLKASIETIINALHSSSNFSVESVANATDMLTMAFETCKELYHYAITDLHDATSYLADSDLHNMNADRIYELRRLLSAVASYQEACLDNLGDDDAYSHYKKLLSDNNLNADQLTGNALDIFAGLPEVLASFNIKQTNNNETSRRFDLEDGDGAWHRKVLEGRFAPNAVVAKDGSGQYKTIGEALKAYKKGHGGRYVVYVKAGIYKEYNVVEQNMVNVVMYGDGPMKTVVTGDKNDKIGNIPVEASASFTVIGKGFTCIDMAFENTAGPKGHQAVALTVIGDMAAFFNCRIAGYQDTLYVVSNRQFYRNCTISGTIDFIFGDSSTVIQDSLIVVRKGQVGYQNVLLAHGRDKRYATTALVLHNCKIQPEPQLFAERLAVQSYIGRPWKKYARTVVMESDIGDLIQPAGYIPMKADHHQTCYFAESIGGQGLKSTVGFGGPGLKVSLAGRKQQHSLPESYLVAGRRVIG